MNAPEDKLASLLALTRAPFPASRKVHVTGSRPDLRVPMREVTLTNGETVTLYDTSGPYTDPAVAVDVTRGLPALRQPWIDARDDTETYDGRSAQPIDDGARDAERLQALRAQSAALQRRPRRAFSRMATNS
ncbi:MAG TPA: phosphomethylpyrimidine synthase ThiC, partial [Burkholderiaceae bacterium]|nr:phosphomethylpyrimidine synthase ThiC [Burkholderiaceae bacterium]